MLPHPHFDSLPWNKSSKDPKTFGTTRLNSCLINLQPMTPDQASQVTTQNKPKPLEVKMINETHSDPKDSELASVISSRIRQMGEHIHVQVKGGVVHLSGTTNEYEDKRGIMTLVQGMGGVHQVVNNIRVAQVGE
jgi:hypothetical protein